MRSLKRMFTMLLVFAMLITSVGITAFAESQFSDITDQKVEVAVDKLVAYGIITGYEDGTFRPDNQITRAEFAAIVTRMVGVAGSLPTDAVTGFADLDNDPTRAWARPYVKAAVDLKIINGFEDGTFRAGEPVTYEQAVKMLVCAIGYEIIAQSELKKLQATNPAGVTWSSGYIAAANKYGLTKGVITAQITQPASRGVVAVLTSNSVDAPKLQEDENGNLTMPGEGEETQNNVVTISGTVTGTYYTGLTDDETGLNEREITIYSAKEGVETYTLNRALAETIDLDAYIGKKVDAYYDNLEGEITEIKLRGTTSTIINEADITDIDGTSIKYVTSGTNTKTVDLGGHIFIVNGKYVSSYDLENEFTNGTIELFTAADDGVAYDVAKINSYQVFVVNSFDKTNEKIYFKYGATYDGEIFYKFPARSVDKPQIYKGKTLTPFDNLYLSQYDVINFQEAPAGVDGPTFSRMYVTSGVKSGKVTKQIGGGTGRKVVLDNKTMYLTNQYLNFTGNATDEKAPFELSESYSYYLDYTGQIAAVNYNSAAQTGNWLFGYLIDAGEDENGDPAVKIFTTGGQKTVYKLKDTVKFDGEKKKADTAIGLLEDSAETFNVNASVVAGTSLNDYAQPIRYSLTSSKIDAIDTIEAGEGGTSDNLTYDGEVSGLESTSSTRVTSGGETFSVDSSTIVMFIPKNRDEETSYAVMKPSSAFSVTANRYVDVLAVDNNNTAKMVLVYGINPTYNFIYSSPYMLVDGIVNGGEAIEGYVKGDESVTAVTVSEDNFVTVIGDEEYLVSAGDVDHGDIIRYIVNNKSEIIAIQMIYDASTGTFLDGTEVSFHDEEGSGHMVMRFGETVALGTTDKTVDIECDGDTKTYRASSTKYFKFADGELGTSSVGDVKIASLHAMNSTVIVITNTTGNNPSANVIYIIE